MKLFLGFFVIVFILIVTYAVIENSWQGVSVLNASTVVCNTTTRQQYITQVCEEEGWTHESWDKSAQEMLHVLVDDKHKILYFMNPKVGTLSFRTLFGVLATGNSSFAFDMSQEMYREVTGLTHFGRLPADRQEHVFNTYTKFTLIRHPLDRLRAIYDAKLSHAGHQNPTMLNNNNRKHIDDYFKEKGIKREKKFNPHKEILTFEQFLDLVGTKYEQGFYNSHWKPMMDRTWACDIKYDIIIRLETIESEEGVLVNYLKLYEKNPELVQIVHTNQHMSQSSGMDNKMRQLTDRYKDIAPDVIRRLKRVYEQDFLVFGYGWDERRGEAYCSMSRDDTVNCC